MEFLNKNTRNSLDMDYVFHLIVPRTPYGSQLKREMQPFHKDEFEKLEKDYDETSRMIRLIKENQDQFKAMTEQLAQIKEIRQSIGRALESMVLDEFEFFEIKSLLFTVGELVALQNQCDQDIISMDTRLFRLKDVEDLLDPEAMQQRAFYIYDSYSEELVAVRNRKRETQRRYDAARKALTTKVEQLLSVKLKLSGEVTILKQDEERLKNARGCTELIEGVSTMLQVSFKLKNNQEMINLLEELDEIKQKEGNEEYFVKKRLSTSIADSAPRFAELFERLGRLDFFMARAEFSIAIGGIRPILHGHDQIEIKAGRHMKLEQVLSQKGATFYPISFQMQRGVTVITGANMGGKTVNLKLAGMLTAMAQYGLFVPAEKFCTCLFDFIYFSIGDMQSIDSGLSTFGSELSGMIDILGLSDRKGLILIDELARGTNPDEGYAISRAIVHHLKETKSITLFTTHFDGITREMGVRHLRVKGLRQIDYDKIHRELIKDSVTADNREVTGLDAVLNNMDYSLIEINDIDDNGYEVPRDAINIARLMGIRNDILEYAEKIMVERKEDNNGQVTS